MARANHAPSVQPKNRRSGIVIPRRLRWYHHLFAWLIATVVRVISCTWRVDVQDPHGIFSQPGGPKIFSTWHNRLALSMAIWAWVRRRSPAAGLVALISASHDGGILSRALSYFGVQAVRGSSSRRGPQALLELTTWIERGYHVAITPDGPRGPRYQVREGIISLAQLTAQPIIPVSVTIHGKWQLRSWDRFQIPFPFARCEVKLGAPLPVPREADAAAREQLREELQRRMEA